MKHESIQMKLHDVYDEVDASTVGDNVIKEATLQDGSTERKEQACEVEPSQQATLKRSRTKTRCSRRYGHFSQG